MRRSLAIRFGWGTWAVGLPLALLSLSGCGKAPDPQPLATVEKRGPEIGSPSGADAVPVKLASLVKARPTPEYVAKGIAWIIKAQHPDGGWGAGSHAHQDQIDPHAVQVDPATTAFVASALLRNGHTPVAGEFKSNVRRATEYLCGVVEEYSKSGPKITDLEGTQIQAKLGPLVDTAMTAQYLARVLSTVPKSDPLRERIDGALEKCLAKLRESQQKDGSWNVGGGWASVLQSSLGCSALEYAQAAGKPIERESLDRARAYQLGNFDAKTGRTNSEAAAGVDLYAFNSSFRGNVAQAKAAMDRIEEAKKDGLLAEDAPVTEENLRKAGVKEQDARRWFAASDNIQLQSRFLNGGAGAEPTTVATTSPVATPAVTGPVAGVVVSAAGVPAASEEAMLAGFGNNGGEEFFSYMLASESMVILGEKDWGTWYEKMNNRLAKVQNPDGSWSGHHCITSPVFCTAAVVQTITADQDAEMLTRLAQEATALAQVEPRP